MLQDNQPYTTQVRIGMAFQADVPEWTGRVKDDAESLFLGEPFEKEGAQHNLMNDVWTNGLQPVQSVFPGSDEKEDIEMQRLLRILLCFSCFGLLQLNADHELMETNFIKQKEVFVHNIPIYKKISHFCNIYQGLKY